MTDEEYKKGLEDNVGDAVRNIKEKEGSYGYKFKKYCEEINELNVKHKYHFSKLENFKNKQKLQILRNEESKENLEPPIPVSSSAPPGPMVIPTRIVAKEARKRKPPPMFKKPSVSAPLSFGQITGGYILKRKYKQKTKRKRQKTRRKRQKTRRRRVKRRKTRGKRRKTRRKKTKR